MTKAIAMILSYHMKGSAALVGTHLLISIRYINISLSIGHLIKTTAVLSSISPRRPRDLSHVVALEMDYSNRLGTSIEYPRLWADLELGRRLTA
jgi:hypothetical protein